MCHVCVGKLFTNRSLYTGWEASAVAPALPEGPSRRAFMTLAGAAGIAGLGLSAGQVAAQAQAGADIIFQGGTIIPMASAGPRNVEALALRGGKIVAAGTASDLSGLRTGSTRVIDLDGRTLLPGFVDPHQHSCFVALFAELLTDVGYAIYPTRAELIAGLKALDAKLPPGQWLTAYNFDNLLQGGDLSMTELDGVSKDRPIFIWYINMHDGAANSAAFRIAQIPEDVGVLPGGGHFGRGRIEHSTMVRQDQLDRMKKLGVQPTFLMNHVYLYGAAYRDQLFGPERTKFMDPAGACVKAGIPFTLHTDAPCSPLGSLRLVQTAVTRRCTVDNSVIGPDQAVSVEEALKAVTSAAAAQIGQGDRIGSLEPGKEADLVILERDPFKVAPDEIMKSKVSETWVAGEKIFG
jgi:predicted amidohydrolase YtcJ